MGAETRGISVGFTEVLYGVVVANAIYGLSFGLTFENLLLGFALVVIVDDWVDYTVERRQMEPTPERYALTVVLDVVVLVVWYLLTIAPSVGWFLVVLSVFCGLQGLWDVSVRRIRIPDLVRAPTWQLAGFYGVVAAGFWLRRPAPAPVVVACLLVFLVRKGVVWRRRIQRAGFPTNASGDR